MRRNLTKEFIRFEFTELFHMSNTSTYYKMTACQYFEVQISLKVMCTINKMLTQNDTNTFLMKHIRSGTMLRVGQGCDEWLRSAENESID